MKIVTTNLSKIFNKNSENEVTAIDNVSITINDNDFILMTGPSGSGKTTLLSLLGLLTRPTTGKIFFDKEEVTSYSDAWRTKVRREKIGFIFQQYNLLHQYKAWENVSLPLLCRDYIKNERRSKAIEIMEELGIGNRVDFRVSSLSGGEQQRVAIARALITEPEVLFADEPTASVDEDTAAHVIDLFKELRKNGKTLVVASHDRSLIKQKSAQIRIDMGKVTLI